MYQFIGKIVIKFIGYGAVCSLLPSTICLAQTVDLSQYACSKDPAKQLFGKVGCETFAGDAEKVLADTISNYLYGFMKGVPLGFKGEGLCRMKNANGSSASLKTPLCYWPDLARGATNVFGQSCGASSCKFGSRGMKNSTCTIEDALDRGAIIPVALRRLTETVRQIRAGNFNMAANEGKLTCDSFYKELKKARESLDALEEKFMKKYRLTRALIGTEILTAQCLDPNVAANALLEQTPGLTAEALHARCGFFMAERQIQFFMHKLAKCEMFAGINKDYLGYLYKGLKTYAMFVDQLEEICIDVETANRANPDDDDNGDTVTITAQSCYDSGTGYDGNGRDKRTEGFFKTKFAFDPKYIQNVKGQNPSLDKGIDGLPLCGGLLGARLLARRRRKDGRAKGARKTGLMARSILLVLTVVFLVLPQTSQARRAKDFYSDPGGLTHTFTCTSGEQVPVSITDLKADPEIKSLTNAGGKPYIDAIASIEYMWNYIEQYFYCRRRIQCDNGDFRRFFKKSSMLHAVASTCKIKKAKIKAEIISLWDARKSCTDEPFIRMGASYTWDAMYNSGRCQKDYNSDEEHATKKARRRLAGFYRAEAAQACKNTMSFTGYTRKTKKKEGAAAIASAEEGFKVFWTDVENMVKSNEQNNPRFCPRPSDPEDPNSVGDGFNDFNNGLANTAALGGMPFDPQESKPTAEGSSSAAVGASAATEGGIVDKGEAKGGTRTDVAGGMKAPKFDMMNTLTGGAKGGAGASDMGGSGAQAAKGEKESALTAGAKPAEQIGYEATGKGAGKQGSPFTGAKFGSDFDSAGKGASAVGFSRDSAGAAAGGAGTGEEDPETYLARAGTGSLFERVHPHFSRWGDQVQSGKWQSEFKRLGK